MLLLRYPLVLQARAVSYEGECTYFLRHFAPRLPQGYEWFCVEYKFSPLWSQSRGTTKKNGFFFSIQNESKLKGTKPKCIICQNMENTEKYPHPAFPLLPPLRPHLTIIIRYYIKRPSNARILVGFHSWTVEGQTFRWRHYQQYFASLSYHPKPKGSTLSSVCSETDHSRRQNVVRTSVTHSAVLRVPLFFYLPFFDLICVLLLNRSTATWNIFVYPLALKSD